MKICKVASCLKARSFTKTPADAESIARVGRLKADGAHHGAEQENLVKRFEKMRNV